MDYNYWLNVPTENEVARSMSLIQINGDLLVSGARRQIVIFGGAGCGKTFTINRALDGFRRRGLDPIYANPTGYKDVLEAFAASRAGSGGKPSRARPIFFDEADTIFGTEKCLNILKVAFATDRRARIYDDLLLDAPVCISSNRLPGSWTAAKRPHINALFDRQPPIIVKANPFASWQYACYLAAATDMNRRSQQGRSIGLDVQVRALTWFTDNAAQLAVVGPRALHQAAETMSLGIPRWAEEEELATMLGGANQMAQPLEQWDWRELILNLANEIEQQHRQQAA
jgi:hypothetical protein